ncbi:MAG: hypothetical protein WC310_04220 [Patescibacteria group bacterium]|jgi:hypothetical protein
MKTKNKHRIIGIIGLGALLLIVCCFAHSTPKYQENYAQLFGLVIVFSFWFAMNLQAKFDLIISGEIKKRNDQVFRAILKYIYDRWYYWLRSDVRRSHP